MSADCIVTTDQCRLWPGKDTDGWCVWDSDGNTIIRGVNLSQLVFFLYRAERQTHQEALADRSLS